MTPADLRKLLDDATPGPWKQTSGEDVRVFYAHHSHRTALASTPENATLISAARNILPALLDLWEATKDCWLDHQDDCSVADPTRTEPCTCGIGAIENALVELYEAKL